MGNFYICRNAYTFIPSLMNHLTTASRTILLGLVLLFMITTSRAQVKPYNFPKIKPEDFSSRVYEKDTSAVAVILGDKGESYFDYNESNGFQLIYTRHLRMRILNKEGYSFATQSIMLYHNTGSSETVSELKGYAYNLVGGKVTEDKMGSSNIFEEQVTQNWVRTIFTVPNIKVGSIIDVRYKITSDFTWNLREWKFQSTIPVQWSEYTVTIPEYYSYSRLIHGSVPFVISEITTTPGSVTFNEKERSMNSKVVQTSYDQTKIDFSQSVYHLAVRDVPAMVEEPFAPAMTNYISKVEFELQHTQFPGKQVKNYTTSWQDICDELLLDQDFGIQIQKGRIVKDAAAMINKTAGTPFEKMVAAHALIRSEMSWNGRNNLYPTTTLREAYDKKTGNSADINLMLLILLDELGLDPSPVVLSTHDNGILVDSHPVLTQLNYVLASVTIDGKTWLLDATGKHRPYTFLPSRCLNGSGMLVSKNNMRWIPLLGDEKENTLYHAEMKINADGLITGVLNVSQSGYAAEAVRNDYTREGADNYFKTLKEHHKDWKITDIKVDNTDSISASVNQHYQLSSEDIAQLTGNTIYFNALLGFGQNSNPFKAEKRENVVDFMYPVKDVYVFSFEIPEGFMVESMPESVKLLLPGQGGSFKFVVTAVGNKVSVNSALTMTKIMFTAEEYADLRAFFTQVVAKHAQQIVLKKI